MSGQFVGLAKMVGPVDFNKNLEYWQQEKWNGCFPVKWHMVKDVPNSVLKHIILENNDNKPVTNSRDTQEVRKYSHLGNNLENSMPYIMLSFVFYKKTPQLSYYEKTNKRSTSIACPT